MGKITKQLLLSASMDSFHLFNDNYTLASNAAYAAAAVLAGNWEDALAENDPVETLVKDVDEVCELLQKWKQAVLHDYGKKD